MEKGTVKFFNGAEGKQFGFAIVDGGGSEIFFHLNDHRPLEIGATGQIIFDRMPVAKRSPKAGDRIVFMTVPGGKGLKASPWEYEQVYIVIQAKAQKIAAEQAVVYRVLMRYDVAGQKGKEEVEFEGPLKEFNRRFPKPTDRRRDDLATGFSCSDFDKFVRFEQKSESGGWVDCDDPRMTVHILDFKRF